MLPAHLTTRFVTAEQDAAVVTGRIPDIDASDLLPTVNRLDKALDAVRAAHPDYQISVSGLAVIAARNSAAMIHKINLMLTAEMVVVSALIGLAFRSLLIGVVSLLPGLFPVVTAGASLALTGEGLQFASIIALTVAFGLGLNATIHYLNRLRLEESAGHDPVDRGLARRRADGAGADPDQRRAGLRAGRDGVLRPALAAAVRPAERHDADRRDGRRVVAAAGLHAAGASVPRTPRSADFAGGRGQVEGTCRSRLDGRAPSLAKAMQTGRADRAAQRLKVTDMSRTEGRSAGLDSASGYGAGIPVLAWRSR